MLRLKGGDPFVFGRGGEEAAALAAAGVPFRIMPGVTAGLAALAAALIPATLRGVNRAVIFAAGYGADADGAPDWAALARTGEPIVLYMAMRNLAEIAQALMGGGLAPHTPAAVIAAATTAGRARPGLDAGPHRRGCAGRWHRGAGDRRDRRHRDGAGKAARGRGERSRRDDGARPHRRGAALGVGQDHGDARLLAALARRGVAVRAAKAGPDYIDPAFHAAATGAPSVNLDSWAMAPPLLDALACEASQRAELLVIEGVMGLFDGVAGLAGPQRLDRRSRRALPPAGAARARRVRPVADGGRGGARLCRLRPGGAHRRRRAQSGRQRAPSRRSSPMRWPHRE